nr:bifunctional epoxide hydrolase 2-like [Ipomoea batatas]
MRRGSLGLLHWACHWQLGLVLHKTSICQKASMFQDGRTFGEQIDLPADPKVEVPGLFIMGEKDYALKVPGMEEYTRSGMLKAVVPKLETVFIAQGSHFVQEQLADEVNQLILSFLTAHSSA